MDPDENLREQRRLIEKINTAVASDDHCDLSQVIDPLDVCDLIHLIESMDKWLSKKGFLPEAWAR